MLVNGIDIHPVAVEIARSTLLRALPAMPTGGVDSIRIWQGDSLGQSTSQFQLADEEHVLVGTPGQSSILLPLEFIDKDPLMSNLRLLVRAATDMEPSLVDHLTDDLSETAANTLRDAVKSLSDIIQREGNGVWAWFITNQVAPHRLSQSKIDRIVANPPWVRMSDIQVEERKFNLEAVITSEGLWPAGIGNRGAFDISALFLRICPQRYLVQGSTANVKSGWITNAGAIKGGNWASYNKTRPPTRIVSLAEVKRPPFSGAKSCVHYMGDSITKTSETLVFASRVRDTDDWKDIQPLAFFNVTPQVPDPEPSAFLEWKTTKSGKTKCYSLFTAGCRMSPKNFVVCESTTFLTDDTVDVETLLSSKAKAPWKGFGKLRGNVPASWIHSVIHPDDLLPYHVVAKPTECIIPTSDKGERLSDQKARSVAYWKKVADLYRDSRSRGQGIPDNLVEYQNMQNNLKRLWEKLENMKLAPSGAKGSFVYHNASGQHFRAARTLKPFLCSDKSYWFSCSSEEAAYITAVLNSDVLAPRICSTMGSDRDFHTNLWKQIPIPRYDPTNVYHQILVRLSELAETEAGQVVAQSTVASKQIDQEKVSPQIRKALRQAGIALRIDRVVRKIIPAKHII